MSTDSILEPSRLNARQRTEAGRLKRVLFTMELNPAGKFPTVAEYALLMAREFSERGSLFLPVYLPPLDPDMARRHAELGVGIEELDLRTYRLPTLRRLLRLIRENRIEVVHWNFYHPLINSFPWILTVLAPRVEHFFTDHTSRPARDPATRWRASLKSLLKRPLMRRFRKTLCISEYVKSELQKQHWPNLHVLYNFVNTERFRPDPEQRREARRSLGVDGEFVALTVAYLIKDKGVDVAVKALAELPEDVVLWIVGDGPERGNLEALAQDLNLGRRVRCFGSLQTIVPLIQAADCFLCPSVWKEGAGSANLEAMACGLPDIASRIGGIPELVEDGRNGFLFTPGDHRELAERIHRLREDPELRHRMGQEARSLIVERYSTHSLLSEHLGVYGALRF